MEYLSKGPEAQTYVQIKEHKINALALKEKNRLWLKLFQAHLKFKGVVASYQAALSEEYTPLERVQQVLTWSRGYPGHNKMVSGDQIQ